MEFVMARVSADIGLENYKVAIRAGRHELTGDEGRPLGGADAGPAPYELLLAGLAACTSITLRMYAERKQWALTGLHVDLHFVRTGDTSRIERTILVRGDLSDSERARLAEIAERTQVTLTLKSGLPIDTDLRAAD